MLSLLLAVMLPVLMQGLKVADSQFVKDGLSLAWKVNAWSWNNVGVHYPDNEHFELLDKGELTWLGFIWKSVLGQTLLVLTSWVVLPVLAFFGVRAAWRAGGAARFLALVGIAAPVSAVLHHWLFTQYHIHQWYMIYVLPPWFTLIALGLKQRFSARYAVAAGGLVVLFWFGSRTRGGLNEAGPVVWDLDHGKPTARSLYERGGNIYETWADGRVLRLAPKP
jgi:hypothetical protein